MPLGIACGISHAAARRAATWGRRGIRRPDDRPPPGPPPSMAMPGKVKHGTERASGRVMSHRLSAARTCR